MPDTGYVITANGDIKGIYIGTGAEADAVCRRLCAEYKISQEAEFGDLAAQLMPLIFWAAHRVPIMPF